MTALLIRNAHVFAPAPLGLCNLFVAGGRIVWIGSEPIELPSALAAATLDLEGRRLIPGLIDGHVHVSGGGGEAGFRTRVPPLGIVAASRAPASPRWSACSAPTTSRAGPRELLATLYALREEGLSA